MATKYDHSKVEKKWQALWLKTKLFSPQLSSVKKPYYNLMMFPYPSAEGMHVGNMYAFTGADVYGRYQRMNGYDVLEPIGLDGFGIHSENYAIKVGRHPKEHAEISEKNFYKQLHMIGNSFDWERTLETYDPNYYKWTQWLFVQMFKAGLAYKDKALVNWCPQDKTVLSDEQVEGGKCERCGSEVTKREMSSWFFRITNYADRLLENIEKIEWPEKIKIAQRNWIGKKEGAKIKFNIKGHEDKYIEVFTTRPDTIFGVTFLVVSPNHPLVADLFAIGKDVMNYLGGALIKKDNQGHVSKEKTGVQTSYYGINPVNNELIPIFISDYVVEGFGTGAVMGVPAHDEDDFEFALKFDIPRRKVVDSVREFQSLVIKKSVGADFPDKVHKIGGYIVDFQSWGYRIICNPDYAQEYIKIVQNSLKAGPWYVDTDGAFKSIIFKNKTFSLPEHENEAKIFARNLNIPEEQIDWQSEKIYPYCFPSFGVSVNSGDYSGMTTEAVYKRIVQDFNGKIESTSNYHLRDWGISRQRYWGPPIPMIYCKNCAKTKTSQADVQGTTLHMSGWFPVPETDLPVLLPDIKDFKPQGDGTSPLHNAPDSWKKVKCPNCGKNAERELDVSDTFLDSSWYFLAYPNLGTREWKGHTSPLNKEITKKWLPVNTYIGGAEHAVLHLLYARFVTMFLKDQGYLDFEEPFPFLFGHGLIIKDGAKMSKSKGNVVNPDEYISKFGADTLRTYLMFLGQYNQGGDFRDSGIEGMNRFIQRVYRAFQDPKVLSEKDKNEVYTRLHKTIKKVTNDLSNFKYNTAISAIMELVNTITEKGTDKEILKDLCLMIAPFAPHLAEEVWVNLLGQEVSVHKAAWPAYDDKFLEADTLVITVQINGKLRSTLTLKAEVASDKDEVIKLAEKDAKVTKYLDAVKIKNIIFVSGKLLNFVTE